LNHRSGAADFTDRVIGPDFQGCIRFAFRDTRYWAVKWSPNLTFLARGASPGEIANRCAARGWKVERVDERMVLIWEVNSVFHGIGRVRVKLVPLRGRAWDQPPEPPRPPPAYAPERIRALRRAHGLRVVGEGTPA
jgi:hypothetical protein